MSSLNRKEKFDKYGYNQSQESIIINEKYFSLIREKKIFFNHISIKVPWPIFVYTKLPFLCLPKKKEITISEFTEKKYHFCCKRLPKIYTEKRRLAKNYRNTGD
jgi:hypothetical protein